MSSTARHPTEGGSNIATSNAIYAFTPIDAGGVVVAEDKIGPQSPKNVATSNQKRRNLSLASISIPTFLSGSSILKRKPLPANSPVRSNTPQQRSASIDSPRSIKELRNNETLKPTTYTVLSPIPSPRSADIVVRDLDQNPHQGTTPLVKAVQAESHIAPPNTSSNSNSQTQQDLISPIPPLASSRPVSVHSRNKSAPIARQSPKQAPRHDRAASTRSVRHPFLTGRQQDAERDTSERGSTRLVGPRGSQTQAHRRGMTSFSSHGSASGHNLQLSITRDHDNNDFEVYNGMPKTPRSPPQRKLSNFFGFRKSPGPDSPSTYHSGPSAPVSPMPGAGPNGSYFGGKLAPAALDIPKANAFHQYGYMASTPGLPSPPISSTHAADLEQEMRELSTELANSLRREMELEDELERMKESQTQTSDRHEAARRTSDYFSDSGAGSVRYPGDGDGKIEQLERLRRHAEQEKAKLKIQMSDKLQDALNQRREAEERSIVLHERLKAAGVGEQNSQNNPAELRIQLEETKRKLTEESQFRQNFQDLVGGMRLELEQIKNERDNLRDEVVPSLRSRLDGLESESANNTSMTYENTRMSQELQALRTENLTLKQAGGVGVGVRFSSIEEDASPASPSGLSRSRSFAARGGRSSRTNSIIGPSPSSGLSRATSVKDPNKVYESREVLTQKVKDAEAQRDALHKALKSMVDRHLVNERKHGKKLAQLEKELLGAQTLTPRRTAFHDEVKQLRGEIAFLRRRADDALDQKWQLEKNFSGVRMDLDRAREETGDLRQLLGRRDMFLPDRPGSRDGTKALDKAYKELRTTHALSIAHLKDMENKMGFANSEAEKTLELLKQSISDAEQERDSAQSQAAAYREQARNLQKSELDHLSKEQNLSAELYASAQRMDDLANQVQSQIQSNSGLRQKLAEAIERGEREQKDSSTKISTMQARLRELEDKLVAAQQASEAAVGSHEQEVQELKEAHNAQLQRTKASLTVPAGSTRSSVAGTPTSALFAPKSPIRRVSMAQATQTGALEYKVRELEKALNDAEVEMSEVVRRMNSAQMEVAELQSERDEAMMQSRKLQAEYLKEREKVQQLMLTPTTF